MRCICECRRWMCTRRVMYLCRPLIFWVVCVWFAKKAANIRVAFVHRPHTPICCFVTCTCVCIRNGKKKSLHWASVHDSTFDNDHGHNAWGERKQLLCNSEFRTKHNHIFCLLCADDIRSSRVNCIETISRASQLDGETEWRKGRLREKAWGTKVVFSIVLHFHLHKKCIHSNGLFVNRSKLDRRTHTHTQTSK